MDDDDTVTETAVPELNLIDLSKFEAIVAMAKAADVEYLRIGDLELKFKTDEPEGTESTTAIGFEAQGSDDSINDPDDHLRRKNPGYSRLFPGGFPKYPAPKAE